ncbi:glycoside hydrolase family 65 protein [Lachnoclostridium phytofermentans]|uniref:Kojibiose phosphorylase n=1 Tax=Lachnoclostridium phytofermentans (strain ATCC 700394 / DSM 18823 / ISDg) TaxID=357809 RepID=A9KSL6_LACP7|nr:glycosyl hydrolase family 65 protein [Lachnoclostridium phytofermentans]ABX43668.1 Kojibiose phosphorylase [Lachnoclostridium phytofermentans ISDg]
MAKIADLYYKADPFQIIEEGFDPNYAKVSESIFSLGNEYMGVRGYFEEGYSSDSLVGSYFNGIYERAEVSSQNYKGIIDYTEFMVNSVDYFYTKVSLDGEQLDLAKVKINQFRRYLDLKTGVLKRSFIWELQNGKQIEIMFERFLSMSDACMAGQRIRFLPLNFDGKLNVSLGLDFTRPHYMTGKNYFTCVEGSAEEDSAAEKNSLTEEISKAEENSMVEENSQAEEKSLALEDSAKDDSLFLIGTTKNTGQKIASMCKIDVPNSATGNIEKEENKIAIAYQIELKKQRETVITKVICNLVCKKKDESEYKKFNVRCEEKWNNRANFHYDQLLAESIMWWKEKWKESDIVIEGDELNQQGIRYCIFQMHQTYHGTEAGTNIGAKGLTGEAYSGNAFWDTETYCLPFYIFNNLKAAKNLLMFRYETLEEAKLRAKELDCKGAFYPIATISGRECCSLWQHSSLQLQASTGVAYGIWSYVKLTNDVEFLHQYGIPMLIEISRMLVTRGDYNADGTKYGYYGVMGPDEFQMMVNHNCYTNVLGKLTLKFTYDVMKQLKEEGLSEQEIVNRYQVSSEEIEDFKKKADDMWIPYHADTLLFEQHQGYFDLPHVDVDAIPIEEFPLYHHWTYDRIYRNDMIKQPDVLMMMLLFNSNFTIDQLKANYEFYEPRCIHESSLSPSVHSILASQLKKHKEAYQFFGFATRMDLDNYNRNTDEGLHTTSIAAAWMNIVYGFGGMRADGELLSFTPSIPETWTSYSFRIGYRGNVILVEVSKKEATFQVLEGSDVLVKIYENEYTLDQSKLKLEIPC